MQTVSQHQLLTGTPQTFVAHRQEHSVRRARLIATFISLALMANCGGAKSARQLFEFVPASSVFAAGIDWRAVKDDDALQRLFKNNNIERVFDEFGMTGGDVDEFVVFGDGRDAKAGSTGLILRGRYEAESLIEKLKSRGWHEQTQDGVTLYNNSNNEDYLALRDDLLIGGTRAGVLGVIKSGDGESLTTHPAYEQLAAHLNEGNAPIFVIVAAPQQLQDMANAGLQLSSATLGFVGLGAVGGIVGQLGAVRGVGCAIEHEANGFPVELVAVMRDEEAASLVSGTLNLAQGFASAVPRDKTMTAQSQQLDNFRSMTVTREAEVLSIKMVMTEAQLQVH